MLMCFKTLTAISGLFFTMKVNYSQLGYIFRLSSKRLKHLCCYKLYIKPRYNQERPKLKPVTNRLYNMQMFGRNLQVYNHAKC